MGKAKSMIYMAQCTVDRNLIYIGKTNQPSLEERIIQHEQQAKQGDSAPFHQAMIDYGLKNWEWTVLDTCDVEDEFRTEKHHIRKIGRVGVTLLNVTYKKEVKEKKAKKYSSKIIKDNIAHKSIPHKKSELGNLFTKLSGKIKPVVNLKTGKRYPSQLQASKIENVPVSTIRNSCNTGKMLKDGTRYANLDIDEKPILKDGHTKEIYIGQNSRSRKVKNLINGKIYKNSYSAAKAYKLSPSAVDGAARGDYMTLKNKYVFCFLNENGDEIIKDKHKKGLEKIKSKELIKYVAWHIDDEKMESLLYFKTLNDLCKKINIKNKTHVKSVCEGKRYHVENWRVAFFDHSNNKPILKKKHNEKPKKRLRRIVCLNDKKEFKSGIEAGKYYGLNSSQITKCAGGGAKSVYRGKERLRFAFLDDGGKPILTQTHREPLSQKGKKRIKRLKTGKIYNSLAEYLRETSLPYKTAKKYLKDPNIDLLGYEFIEID